MAHYSKSCGKCNKGTIQEETLLDALISRGIHAKLGLWDGYKHIDIAIPDKRINIEVDGPKHNKDHKQALADLRRTYYSFKKRYFTLRIPNSLIENNLNETVELINDIIKIS